MRRLLTALVRTVLVAALFSPPAPAASSNQPRLEFRGRVLLPPGTLRPRRWITVNLLALGSPYYTRTVAQHDGRFRFKGLEPGTYTLVFALPRVGQLSRTVELTRSFADAKGRIELQFEYTPEQLALTLRPEERSTVSVRELRIPYGARREFEKAQSRLRRRDAEGAIRHLGKAIAQSPEFAEAINALGVIHFQRKQYEEAEESFRRALDLEEDGLEPLINLGGVLLTRGEGREALEVNRRAFERMPQDALACAQLGLSHYLLGEYGQAIHFLDLAKERDPAHFTFPQLTLAQIFLRLNQPESALEEVAEFVRLHPDSTERDRALELRQAAESAIRKSAERSVE